MVNGIRQNWSSQTYLHHLCFECYPCRVGEPAGREMSETGKDTVKCKDVHNHSHGYKDARSSQGKILNRKKKCAPMLVINPTAARTDWHSKGYHPVGSAMSMPELWKVTHQKVENPDRKLGTWVKSSAYCNDFFVFRRRLVSEISHLKPIRL